MNADSWKFVEAYFGTDLIGVYVCTSGNNYQPIKLERTTLLPESETWYICLARLSGLSDTGQRVLDKAVSVHGFMADDIGTKIDRQVYKQLVKTSTTVVETSKGNFQAGQSIPGGMPVAEWNALRARLPWPDDGPDCVHWWRLPGGTHWKNGFRTRAVQWGPVGDLSWLPAEPRTKRQKAGPSVDGGSMFGAAMDVAAVEALLKSIGNPAGQHPLSGAKTGRGFWMNVGRSVWRACGKDGWAAFDAWSATWPGDPKQPGSGYDPDLTRKLWDSFAGETVAEPYIGWEYLQDLADRMDGARAFEEPLGAAAADVEARVQAHARAVARLIAGQRAATLRFNSDRGEWYEFDGVRWKRRAHKRAFELAEHWVEGVGSRMPVGKAEATALNKSTFCDMVENFCRNKSELHAEMTDFDQDPMLLGTPGGVVDLSTGVLRGARGGDMVSKMTAVAPGRRADCPQWLKFLGQVTRGDREVMRFLQQWWGYGLSGLTKVHAFLFVFGPGGNGKSVMVETVSAVMGEYFHKPPEDLFLKKVHARHRQELAALVGVRMVATVEVPAGSTWNEGLLKEVTGGSGSLTANFMRENNFTFRPMFKLTVTGNDTPLFGGGLDRSIMRRFKLLEFLFQPKVEDLELMDKLKAEWPGILRWMIDGFLDWQLFGMMYPQALLDASDDYFAQEDLLGQWISRHLEPHAGSAARGGEMFESWIVWRDGQGNRELYNNKRAFSEALKKRGLKTEQITGGYRALVGFRLKNDENGVFGVEDADPKK